MGYRVGKGQPWTNPSVIAFAGDRDPIEAILEKARDVATAAVDKGWAGPPYDPVLLAEVLGIQIVPFADVTDARTRFNDAAERFIIELNPMRPRVRQRFSIAHEIAHTLFPDCKETMRNRTLHRHATPDDWQLEALCNIAAAELLMPLGSMPEDLHYGDIDETLELRKQYQVSVEAIAIRTVQLSTGPIAMFSASRIESGPQEGRYKLDYAIESSQWAHPLRPGELISDESPIRGCTAIGYTQKGQAMFGPPSAFVECVGVGGYPGAIYPRTVGYLYESSSDLQRDPMTHIVGDAVDPETTGPRIVAFMVNDATATWGGGFAKQVAVRHSEAQITYRRMVEEDRSHLALGSVALLQAEDALYYAPIVAQHGFGKSNEPRIQYAALERALKRLGIRAAELGATVHMPRIGAGAAGGNWDIIREMIREYVGPFAQVYVYDLPPRLGRRSA
ncbi:MAG: ImmA/IrrE family metallo-endopeptidase [Bryobacteraceae bacterium]